MMQTNQSFGGFECAFQRISVWSSAGFWLCSVEAPF